MTHILHSMTPAQPTFQTQHQASSSTALPLIFTTALHTGTVLGNRIVKLPEGRWVSWLRQRTRWPHNTSRVSSGRVPCWSSRLHFLDRTQRRREAGRAVTASARLGRHTRKQAAWGLLAPRSISGAISSRPTFLITLCLD